VKDAKERDVGDRRQCVKPPGTQRQKPRREASRGDHLLQGAKGGDERQKGESGPPHLVDGNGGLPSKLCQELQTGHLYLSTP